VPPHLREQRPQVVDRLQALLVRPRLRPRPGRERQAGAGQQQAATRAGHGDQAYPGLPWAPLIDGRLSLRGLIVFWSRR